MSDQSIKQYQVNITDAAARDLRDIFTYIAVVLQSSKNADSQLSRLQSAIGALETLPDRHRLHEKEPWRSYGVRRVPVDNDCVFYLPRHDTGTVDILRVLYARRDLDTVFQA